MNISSGSNSAQVEVFSFVCAEGYEYSVNVARQDKEQLLALLDIARFMSHDEYNEVKEIISNL